MQISDVRYINTVRSCCGQLLIKHVNEVKLVALSVKLDSIVKLCDAWSFEDASNDRPWGQLFLKGFYYSESTHLLNVTIGDCAHCCAE